MELSETYQFQALPKQREVYHVSHLPRRNVSPKQEKEELIKMIEAISLKNQALKQKQESLQNTIYDLRKLLEFVGKQSFEECSYVHQQNKILENNVKNLSKTLSISHQNSSHLQKCALYWSQFLE